MKLKTLLASGILVSCIILIALGSWGFAIYQKYESVNINSDLSHQITLSAFKLNLLTTDYLLYYQPRASRQWIDTHSKLDKLLSEKRLTNLTKNLNVQSFKKIHNKTLDIFNRIKNTNKLINENKTNIILLEKQKKALISQLITNTQFVSSYTEHLSEIIERDTKDIDLQLSWLITSIFFIFLIFVTILWITLAYRIVKPINALSLHIRNIHASNLNERYLESRNDEIGELAFSFNTMASDLLETTVSKHELIKENEERKQIEKELLEHQVLNNTVIEGAGNIITIIDNDGRFVKFNHAAEAISEYSRMELLKKTLWETVIPQDQIQETKKIFNHIMNENLETVHAYENTWISKSGKIKLIEWHNTVIKDSSGHTTHLISIGHDITEKKKEEKEQRRLQRELNQSRKMEALGQLTGGVAHDFNNMLGIILGYTDLALEQTMSDKESRIKNYLDQIKTASSRSKELVAQMLAFSRTSQEKSQPLALPPLLVENLKMLKSIIPSSIHIELVMEENVDSIIMDPVQFQQILMNLIINSKDALDNTGHITISLSMQHQVKTECSACHQHLQGDWVELSVTDDGKGMTKEVAEKVFEPFFTTKSIGEGTGMGMSVLHGIVKSHKGHIILNSTSGSGTTFRLLFPPAAKTNITDKFSTTSIKDIQLKGNNRNILIVDDQEALAEFQNELLSSKGFKCTIAQNGDIAFNAFQSDPDRFDLIITDQTMPQMTGTELITKIRKIKSDIPILLATGYSETINPDKLKAENVLLLHKPLTASMLLSNVAGLLDTK